MTDSAGLPYRVADLERRMAEIEKLQPAVLAERVTSTQRDVQSLKRAFYTFAFSVVGSAVLFAFTVFSLLGHH
jgi:hypothetical protein